MTILQNKQLAPPAPAGNSRGTLSNLTADIESTVRRAERRLGDASQAIFFLGDGLQRAGVDAAFDLVKPTTWNPINLLRQLSVALSRLSSASQFIVPSPTAGLAWREIRNKVEALVLVKNLASVLNWPPNPDVPLTKLVERAYSFSAFEALFAVEGVGKYYADISWGQGGPPEGLLSAVQAPVPPKSLLMLHAGMGLSFAYRLLGNLTSQSSAVEIRGAIEQFLSLCDKNSRSGYLGAAVECLGFIVREFYPESLPSFHRNWQEVAPEFSGFFWHGVGRACFFSRSNLLPFSRNPLSWVENEATWTSLGTGANTHFAQLNAMAGIAWASTAANMNYPGIILEEMVRSAITRSKLKHAFTDGIRSTLVMRADTTPDDPLISAFYQYQPASADSEQLAMWKDLITLPCDAALRRSYGRLRDHQQLDQLFQYSSSEERDALPVSSNDAKPLERVPVADTGSGRSPDV